VRAYVLLAGPSLDPLLQLSLLLDKRFYSVFVIEAKHPVRRLLLEGAGDPDAAVIHFVGGEDIVDLRRLLDAFPHTRFLFLVPQLPIRAAHARLIDRSGSTVLRSSESPLFVAATLVALMAETAPRRPDSLGA
jgi:hypothetical protein